MSRNPLYQFVDTDTTKLEAALVDAYEAIVGHSARTCPEAGNLPVHPLSLSKQHFPR